MKTLNSYNSTKQAKSQSLPLSSGLRNLNPRTSLNSSNKSSFSSAFTIVELLIVVVVIAILAAITIVSYNGITRSAEEAALKSELSTMAKKVSVEKVTTGSYPSSLDDYSPDNNLTYTQDSTSFCISGIANNTSYYITNDTGTPQEGECGGGSGDPIATTMQAFTQSQCSALTTYTGSNEEAVITLTDNRGGTERTYQVAKLADGNCWMLDNLKLGSTTGSITLTPSDSDVATNFTLPQLITSGSIDYDNPGAYGPVTGDTGSGATNYGYLYNWPAATAGESRTTMPAGSGNAPHSICPANWRLPTGGTTGEFAWLNAKMNDPDATAPATTSGSGFYQNWQNTGPFKGVFSGRWNGSFNYQGSDGYFWSSSAHASIANNAHSALFYASVVDPGYSISRYVGFGVRCLLG